MRRPKVFYGWWIVFVSLIADGMKHGSFNRGFTVFYIPVEQDLGFTRTMMGLAEGLGRMVGGLQGPLMGYCTDRFGPRVMLAFGGLMSGLGFILLGYTGSFWYFLVIFVGFMSVGFRSGYNNASVTAVNNWFQRRRGLAMSIVSMGNGLGGVSAPLVGLLIFAVGWRDACTVLGVAILVVVIPLSWFLRRAPEEMGLLPDGDDPDAAQEAAQQQESGRRRVQFGTYDFTVKEAMRTPSYWLLVMSTGFRNVVHAGTSFLMGPMMVWFLQGGGAHGTVLYDSIASVLAGVLGSRDSTDLLIAAGFVGLFSFLNMCFYPLVGVLGDKTDRRKLSGVLMVSGALSMGVLLNQSGFLWQLTLFVALMALAESANPLNWAIMGDFFGRRSYATLRGWQHLPDQLASMWTAMWMGAIYDHTGSFYWAVLPLAGLYGCAAVAYWFLPSPKLPQRLQDQQDRELARDAAARSIDTAGTAEAGGRAD